MEFIKKLNLPKEKTRVVLKVDLLYQDPQQKGLKTCGNFLPEDTCAVYTQQTLKGCNIQKK